VRNCQPLDHPPSPQARGSPLVGCLPYLGQNTHSLRPKPTTFVWNLSHSDGNTLKNSSFSKKFVICSVVTFISEIRTSMRQWCQLKRTHLKNVWTTLLDDSLSAYLSVCLFYGWTDMFFSLSKVKSYMTLPPEDLTGCYYDNGSCYATGSKGKTYTIHMRPLFFRRISSYFWGSGFESRLVWLGYPIRLYILPSFAVITSNEVEKREIKHMRCEIFRYRARS
jgi:hypothetical protein